MAKRPTKPVVDQGISPEVGPKAGSKSSTNGPTKGSEPAASSAPQAVVPCVREVDRDPSLTVSHEAALNVLIAGGTVVEAGLASGLGKVHVSGLIHGRHVPAFAVELVRRREERARAILDKLRSAQAPWVETLAAIAADVSADPRARVQAARAGLELSLRFSSFGGGRGEPAAGSSNGGAAPGAVQPGGERVTIAQTVTTERGPGGAVDGSGPSRSTGILPPDFTFEG